MSNFPKSLRKIKSKQWEKMRQTNALTLFKKASKDVPAYREFLKKNKVNPSKIKNFKNFESVPPINKNNYLRQNELSELIWNKDLKKPFVFTSTTGSTGDPYFFPRSHDLDRQYSQLAELFLNNGYRDHQDGPTLLIVVFGMGVWIGGLITYQAFEIAARENKFPVSIITPGINKDQIFLILKNLAPKYKQTIIAGYPPFVKDIIDSAIDARINISKLNLRLLFAAEAFSEKFREHLADNAGVKSLELDTLNIYGSADIGAMAWETPTSILVRRLAMGNNKVFTKIFGSIRKTPTLAQYNPNFLTFESLGGQILITGNNSIPLIRYDIGDNGGVWSYTEIENIFKSEGINLREEFKKNKLENYLYELPFVYVYERSDFSVVLSGANIYPEEVKEALLNKNLKSRLTGRFTMEVGYDKQYHETLTINLELKPHNKPSSQLQYIATKEIVQALLTKNSEYQAIHTGKIDGSIPIIKLWRYAEPTFFKLGIKQKWVRKK